MTQEQDELISWCAGWIKSKRRWAMIIWNFHQWLFGLGFALAIAMPFGLAATLYMPSDQLRHWNLILLVLSGTGLILQSIDCLWKLRERASRLRTISNRLEAYVLKFRSASIGKDVLLEEIERFLDSDAKEESP